eukprot:3936249-Rhodomonas_salina.1
MNETCTMRDYLCYQFLSADVREVQVYSDEDIQSTLFANQCSIHTYNEEGIPEIVQAGVDSPTTFEPWLLMNCDKDHPLIISTS